jgi:hypothetical protein
MLKPVTRPLLPTRHDSSIHLPPTSRTRHGGASTRRAASAASLSGNPPRSPGDPVASGSAMSRCYRAPRRRAWS